LCFGFSQITITLPLRLMTLHFSQIGFTDDLTFIFLFFLLPLYNFFIPRAKFVLRQTAQTSILS